MNTIKVNSVEEAVQTAESLLESGHTYLFRGESKVRPLRSTFVRTKPEDIEIVMGRMARYENWIHKTPGLENLASNPDAAIAVAQHYGLATNFVDFTTEPKVAGYFASEKGGPARANDNACIIYLDVDDLKEFWEPLPKRMPPPEFIKIDVPDLWRLEAQLGCFMFCPYDNIENIYDFDRIVFPNTHLLEGINHEDIYPIRKSNLEILLGQFFMNERLLLGARGMRLPSEAEQIWVETPDGVDPEVFPKGLPRHVSWNDSGLRPWLELHAEKYNDVLSKINFQVIIPNFNDMPDLVKIISEQLQRYLLKIQGIRKKLVIWEVQLTGNPELSEDFTSQLASRLTSLWDGLRRLPYSDEDICYGMGMCVAFAIALKGNFTNANSRYWEEAMYQCLIEPIELEFGASDGSYSRGYVSTKSLISAIRPDFYSYMADKWKDQIKGNIRGIIQTSSNPSKTFDFSLLAPIFAREIIPIQVLARKTAIFYSPARLVRLGLP